LTFHLTDISRRIAIQIADIFEDVGTVQEGMMSIARPLQLTDRPDAKQLEVTEGLIEFKDVRFGYGREVGVLDGFSLTIKPGERCLILSSTTSRMGVATPAMTPMSASAA